MIPLGVLASSYVAPAGGASLTYLHTAGDETDLKTYTFTSVPLGSPSTNRTIIILTGAAVGANAFISSASVDSGGGPISATRDFNMFGRYGVAGAVSCSVPTGTTGTVSITFSTGCVRAGIAVFSVPSAVTLYDTDGRHTDLPGQLAVTVPTSGVAFAAAIESRALTWYPGDFTDHPQVALSTNYFGGASTDTTGAVEFTMDAVATETRARVAVSYQLA